MNSTKAPWVGFSLVLIGVIHNVFGLAVGWGLLIDGFRAGFVGAWESPAGRGQFFWFLAFGAALIVAGVAVIPLERMKPRLTRGFIVSLGVLGVAGVVAMPASGFWLSFIPLGIALSRRRQGAETG